MRRLFLSDQPPYKQLLLSGLIIIACWLAFQMFSFVTGILIFRIPLNEISSIMENISDPRSLGFLKYMQAITSFGMFVVAAQIIAAGISDDWISFLKLDKKPEVLPVVMSVILIIILLPFTNLLSALNSQLTFPDSLAWLEDFFREKEEQMQQIMESFLNVKGILALLVNMLIIAVIPAIGEELIFRGVIQDRFSVWFKNHHWAILLTAFIFSALHFQFLSFVPRFFLGIILGYLFVWSGSIWLTILAHFINNAFAVQFYYLYYNGKVEKSIELIGTSQHGLVYSLFSIILGGGLFYGIYRFYKEQTIARAQ